MRPYRDTMWLGGTFRLAPVLAAALALAVLAACGEREEPSPATGSTRDAERLAKRFDDRRAFADLRAQVRLGPRPAGSAANRRLTAMLASRLRDAGARRVRVQRPHRNVVGVIPGPDPGAIVVGAHHDTKDDIPGFVGANDGASGVAVVLELSRALRGRVEGPSIHLVLFDAEEARGDRPFTEDGTRGSAQYVRYARAGGRQGSAPLAEIRAMTLFDLVADCDLEIPLEANSDGGLYDRFRKAALELDPGGGGEPFNGEAAAVLDDHVPFAEAGVPAVDLIDFRFGPGPSPGAWWHTAKDDVDRVCARSLGAVGRPATVALAGSLIESP
ncbi:MAG TPA: M28 family peptidase [Solirubrobacterales bacterium]|nr:M28 family peptidase [Solirubrobacterales bacterium]